MDLEKDFAATQHGKQNLNRRKSHPGAILIQHLLCKRAVSLESKVAKLPHRCSLATLNCGCWTDTRWNNCSERKSQVDIWSYFTCPDENSVSVNKHTGIAQNHHEIILLPIYLKGITQKTRPGHIFIRILESKLTTRQKISGKESLVPWPFWNFFFYYPSPVSLHSHSLFLW